jgi:pimeloyl-ACP methyl ester carboxylesterase
VEVSQTTRLLTFAAVSIRSQRRLKDRNVPILQFTDKIRKTGRKRDAIHTHDCSQRIELFLREQGGLNWYRNLDRNWDLTAPWQGAQIHQPSLFIAGSRDSVITGLIGAKRVTELDRVLPNIKQKLIIDGAGHWCSRNAPTTSTQR